MKLATFISLSKLYPSIKEQRTVEEKHLHLLKIFLSDRHIASPAKRLGMLRYAQKNFFSILFLAIYKSVGISAERRIFYGVINQAIRGIVTAADNILDNEYKEMLPLRFAPDATKFKSVMHLLLFDRFLYHVMDKAAEQGLIGREDRDRILQTIFSAMVPIGEEEATEETGISSILSPAEILKSVHVHRGGNLLRLALVAPILIEKQIAGPLDLADRGVFKIGMALQAIDDLTDFYEDIRDRRHNYLVSSVQYEGTPEEKTKLPAALNGTFTDPIESAFAVSVSRVMSRAVGEALNGFDLLGGAGFWLTREDALQMIRHLFHLRQVGHLLNLLQIPDPQGLTDQERE